MKQTPSNHEQANTCANLIKNAKSIGVLTGAGISTNAGIPDFRGPQGLYITRKYDPEKVFDIHHFGIDPKPFFDFARDFINFEEKIQPTVTHRFLAKLEFSRKLKGVVTQNIDSLHQKAGSEKVYEMHGSFWKSFCRKCGREFSYEIMRKKLSDEEVPRCDCSGVIKPDVVFFGEDVKYWSESFALAESAELFFVIGTSCVVQPAASIPEVTRGKIIVVNMDPVHMQTAVPVLTVQEDLDQFFAQVERCLF